MPAYKTKALFFESSTNWKKDKPQFNLKKEDHEYEGIEYKSAYRIFMDACTEYEAGMIICDGDLENWETLCSRQWFLKGRCDPAPCHLGLLVWRKHKKLKDINEQVQNLKEKAKSGDTAAAKAVLAMLKEADKIQEKGRPKKTQETPLEKHAKNFLKRVK